MKAEIVGWRWEKERGLVPDTRTSALCLPTADGRWLALSELSEADRAAVRVWLEAETR